MDYTRIGKLPNCDNSSITTDMSVFEQFKEMMDYSIKAGTVFSTTVVSTYSLVNSVINQYYGGVLDSNGDIHFIPFKATVGQKISPAGVVSTYSLVYTTSSGAYSGGVLTPDGSVLFLKYNTSAPIQKFYFGNSNLSLALCCSPFFNKF